MTHDFDAPIDLFARPLAEVHELIATGAPVYLCANPVEYHGPHLSLQNDALISLGLVRDLHQRLAERHPQWPLLLATPIGAGSDPVPWPGSRRASYQVIRRLVLDACRSLWELGARRAVLMTFHGSPLHGLALDAGVEWLATRGVQSLAPLNLVFQELLNWDARRYAGALRHVEDPREREDMIRELPFDFHAGFFETSLALHYAPGSVSPLHRSLPPCPALRPDARVQAASSLARTLGRARLAAELDFVAAGLGWYALRPFPGYTGRPHLAAAEAGAIFAGLIADEYAVHAEEVFAGRAGPPRPLLKWLRWVTLGGRVGGIRKLEA